jgi:adenine deaminase
VAAWWTDALFATRAGPAPVGTDSVTRAAVEDASFTVRKNRSQTVPVIGILPGKIITERRRSRSPMVTMARSRSTPAATSSRSRSSSVTAANGNIATGFVQGFGLKRWRHCLDHRPRQPQYLRGRRDRGRHGRPPPTA